MPGNEATISIRCAVELVQSLARWAVGKGLKKSSAAKLILYERLRHDGYIKGTAQYRPPPPDEDEQPEDPDLDEADADLLR